VNAEFDSTPPALQVVGAAIVRDGLVLCALRPPGGPIGGLWEFPGGKVEPEETQRAAIVRECQEELGVIVQPIEPLASSTMIYPRGPITLTTLRCELVAGEPAPTEHAELRWVPISQIASLDWAPLDLGAVRALADYSD